MTELTAADKFSALLETATSAPSGPKIVHTILDVAQILVDKNAAYGNSALDPVRVFSRASTEEQILVRLDDKLSRLQRGSEYPGDDTITDLVGYLVLLLVARGAAVAEPETSQPIEKFHPTNPNVAGSVREHSETSVIMNAEDSE